MGRVGELTGAVKAVGARGTRGPPERAGGRRVSKCVRGPRGDRGAEAHARVCGQRPGGCGKAGAEPSQGGP